MDIADHPRSTAQEFKPQYMTRSKGVCHTDEIVGPAKEPAVCADQQ